MDGKKEHHSVTTYMAIDMQAVCGRFETFDWYRLFQSTKAEVHFGKWLREASYLLHCEPYLHLNAMTTLGHPYIGRNYINYFSWKLYNVWRVGKMHLGHAHVYAYYLFTNEFNLIHFMLSTETMNEYNYAKLNFIIFFFISWSEKMPLLQKTYKNECEPF